jgi:hypothetical protein
MNQLLQSQLTIEAEQVSLVFRGLFVIILFAVLLFTDKDKKASKQLNR